jgi:protein-histidine pros-kinase
MGAAKEVKSAATTDVINQLLGEAPDALVILDADGRMVRLNTQAEKLFGFSQEELLGRKPDLLMRTHRTGRNVKRRASQVAGPKIRPIGHGLESVIRQHDGTEFPVVIDLDLIEVGSNTLISGAIQRVQPRRGREDVQALVSSKLPTMPLLGAI